MLIVRVLGGLGNQLYQYAFAQALMARGKEVKLDVSAYFPGGREREARRLELSMFPGLTWESASLKEVDSYLDRSRFPLARIRRKLFGTKSRLMEEKPEFDEKVFSLEDAYLDGFWQNEAYFKDILPELKKKLVFPWEGLDYATEYYKEKIARENSVGIHIRRTDYIDDTHSYRYGGRCTREYYEAALKLSGKPDCCYLFTDDPAYVIEHVQEYVPEGIPYVLCDFNHGEHSFYDLLLMASCRVMICANSSFSCWGARLNARQDKMMIRPFRMDNTIEPDGERLHREWEGWNFVDSEGVVR